IVVDLDTMGYLRKVNSIEKLSETTYKLITEPAFMGDVFVESHFKLSSENLTVQDLNVDARNNPSIVNNLISKAFLDDQGYSHPVKAVLKKIDGEVITIDFLKREGNIITAKNQKVDLINFNEEFSKEINFKSLLSTIGTLGIGGDVNANLKMLSEFKFTKRVNDGDKIDKGDIVAFEFKLVGNAGASANIDLNLEKKISRQETLDLLKLKSVTLKFLVGGVPVFVTIKTKLMAEYEFSSSAELDASWGFSTNHTIESGLRYTFENNDIDIIKKYTPTNTIDPLRLSGEFDLNASAKVYPHFDALIYNVVGPFIEIVPFISANYQGVFKDALKAPDLENYLAWNSNLDVGLNFNVGTKLDFAWVISKTYGPKEFELFRTNLWTSPYEIAIQNELPFETNITESIEVKIQVKDNLGFDAPFATIVLNDKNDFKNKVIVTDLNGKATFSWMPKNIGENLLDVELINIDGSTFGKSTLKVNLNNLPPTAATLSQPVNNGTAINPYDLFEWHAATDPENDEITYEVFLGKDSNNLQLQDGYFVTPTSFSTTPTFLDFETTYYWKVRATDTSGNAVDSQVWQFTTGVANQAPTAPVLSSPTHNATVNTLTPQLSWTASSDLDGDSLTYSLYFGTASNPGLAASNLSATTYTTGTLAANTTYYWKVGALDSQGNYTESSVWTFETGNAEVDNQPPSVPVLINPTNGEFPAGPSPLIWEPSTDPELDIITYSVYFGSSNPPPLIESNITSTSFSPTSFTPGLTYYWKVKATDSEGNFSESSVWHFTISDTIPSLPSVITFNNHIDATTAFLGGDITNDGGASITARGVCWNTTGNPTIADSTTTEGTGTGQYTSTLSGLSPETTYYARAYATNSQGTAYGNQVQFTTLAPTAPTSGTVTLNGITYKTITIGTQTWLAENLNDAGHTLGNSSCYDNDTSNCGSYGRLYDWAAAKDIANKITGWHLPTDAEWDTLATTLGGGAVAGDKLKAGGSSGFESLFGGYQGDGDFNELGGIGIFWSASPHNSIASLYRSVHEDHSDLFRGEMHVSFQFSVRLLKD
ncbi:MAG: FISUMP domain-containing protein, partial [Wenyingzhuangia sp.]|uniref:FISUMP domain-containing protein n=1 Tax=Wenyingzhuangia sp. TaxID=1964193 RepID=UPI0032192CA0